MKTANVKVRVKDIRQGLVIYTAHPVYGIDKRVITGRPFMIHGLGLFAPYESVWRHDRFSLCDAGITSTYNDRRSFFKLKHAQEWMNKWKTQHGFIERQERHERLTSDYCYDWWTE